MTHSSTLIDPHAAQPTSLMALLRSIRQHQPLIVQLTRREVVGRYKGSFLGMTWSLFNPILMLVVYTFVFSVAFKARWGEGGEEGRAQFALVLFVGLMVHGLLAEVLNRAPTLVLSNVNLVKKVIFPLEILPLVGVLAALFHFALNLLVLIVAVAVFNDFLHWTIVFVPLVLLPLIVLACGFAWMLASLGVYLRDVGQTMGILTAVLMFLSPVFYPLSALPEGIRGWLFLNPATFIIEEMRGLLFWGKLPDWGWFGVYTLVSICAAWAGYFWFQKTRKGFADVL